MFLVAAALACAAVPRARAEGEPGVIVAPPDTRFLYEGRLDTRPVDGPVLIWESSGVSIDFEGRSLALDFDHAEGENFFDVHVDDQVWVAAVAKGGRTRVAVPLGLSPGRHHLSLRKRSEASAGSAQFRGVELAPGARAWRPAALAYALAMEFYGDSITAGACDEDGATDQWETRRTHNAELSYAVLVAGAFGAQQRNISISGIGIATGWIDPVAGQTWDRLYPRPDSPAADLTRWTPDVVLVNLGDNDADYPKAHGKGFPEGFTGRYCDLIRALRRAYPRAQIVMMLGGMTSGAESIPLKEAWGKAVASMESEDPMMHHFSFRHYTSNHPRVADHRALADELIEWLGRQEFMKPARNHAG